jgi:hypothetical protein
MFTADWLTQVQSRLNDDAEMHVIGAWFTVALSLSCGDARCILRFERGRLVHAVVSPRLDVPCAFGFRATPEIWTRFFSDPPQPLYHDIFAMLMRVPGFVLEGDTLVAMQHARALHRAMGVIRTVRPESDRLLIE